MPMSGYDMQRYFDEGGYFWPASHAQVYQELRKMEHEGLIEATIAPRGAKAEKRIYNLTENGQRELQMLTLQPYGYPPERDGMRLQFMYLDLVPFEVAREHLRAHISHYRLAIQHLQGRIDGITLGGHPKCTSRGRLKMYQGSVATFGVESVPPVR